MSVSGSSIATTSARQTGIAQNQNILNNARHAGLVAAGKSRSRRDEAFHRYQQGGVAPGGNLHRILFSILGAQMYARDTMAADATGVITVANKVSDAANGATIAKNPVNNNWYGPMARPAFDDASSGVATALGGAARVLGQQDAKVGATPEVPVAALDSYFNKESVPAPRTAPRPPPLLPASLGDDMQSGSLSGAAVTSPTRSISVTSGGRSYGYEFRHPYGRNRNSADGNDRIAGPRSITDSYLSAMYGSIPAFVPPDRPKIDNPGGHSQGPGKANPYRRSAYRGIGG